MRGIRLLSVISLTVSIVCIVGFIWAYQDQLVPHTALTTPNTPSPQQTAPEKTGMKIVALGDSLTHGYGDVNGKGYVGDVVDQLHNRSHATIALSNLAINGQTSGQLLKQMEQPEVLRQIGQADVILMTIGGNDLNHQARAMNELSPAQFREIFTSYKENLSQILKKIRQANSHATLYLVGLYNPYLDQDNANTTSQILRQWNNDTTDLMSTFPNMVFVPTFDLFQLNENQYLYTDHFHPNTKGYQRIAERVTPLLIP